MIFLLHKSFSFRFFFHFKERITVGDGVESIMNCQWYIGKDESANGELCVGCDSGEEGKANVVKVL